ncbi:hypothetical protein GTY65_02240 [Streptomyces sp. SID8379]|uniref:hypothetical protein n=1 Tax=unclassified Streptomyces TaxID=2593676 RepID=UPI000374CE2A|nr:MULTISPECIES: hypothetical protein [unclassified Streptomyces]MYW62902.1 hypothetical protein [Streptomyces sp. SID8379]
MANEYAVTQDALTRFSKTAQERADRLRKIRTALGAESPNSDAFGKLPESEQTSKDYLERVEATLENLDFAAGQQEQISEFIEKTARSYQETEEHTGDQIRTIAAQSRATI